VLLSPDHLQDDCACPRTYNAPGADDRTLTAADTAILQGRPIQTRTHARSLFRIAAFAVLMPLAATGGATAQADADARRVSLVVLADPDDAFLPLAREIAAAEHAPLTATVLGSLRGCLCARTRPPARTRANLILNAAAADLRPRDFVTPRLRGLPSPC